METALVLGSLKAAYHFVIFGIQLDQVPSTVRQCLELVRTCHNDLQHLIELRNENIMLLESRPKILERMNQIIENAHNGLLEVCRIVEKCRPEAHDGKTAFMSRVAWIFVDSNEFKTQESLISRQHSAVIAELNFLRQLVLMGPILSEARDLSTDKGSKVAEKSVKDASAFTNIGLLGEMMGSIKSGKSPGF
jgi:hypothetical protein